MKLHQEKMLCDELKHACYKIFEKLMKNLIALIRNNIFAIWIKIPDNTSILKAECVK